MSTKAHALYTGTLDLVSCMVWSTRYKKVNPEHKEPRETLKQTGNDPQINNIPLQQNRTKPQQILFLISLGYYFIKVFLSQVSITS